MNLFIPGFNTVATGCPIYWSTEMSGWCRCLDCRLASHSQYPPGRRMETFRCRGLDVRIVLRSIAVVRARSGALPACSATTGFSDHGRSPFGLKPAIHHRRRKFLSLRTGNSAGKGAPAAARQRIPKLRQRLGIAKRSRPSCLRCAKSEQGNFPSRTENLHAKQPGKQRDARATDQQRLAPCVLKQPLMQARPPRTAMNP